MLLTRLPLGIATPFDLHVLGTPPALVLSQDQTLHIKLMEPFDRLSNSRFVRNLATKKVGDPQTYALAALFSFQGANEKTRNDPGAAHRPRRAACRSGPTAIISPALGPVKESTRPADARVQPTVEHRLPRIGCGASSPPPPG